MDKNVKRHVVKLVCEFAIHKSHFSNYALNLNSKEDDYESPKQHTLN